MLNIVLQYINTTLLSLGYFSDMYELAELKPNGDTGFSPKVYCGKGEYKDIKEGNVSYIRLTRPISVAEVTGRSIKSGEVVLSVSFGLRVVGMTKNYSPDNSYKNVGLASDIAKVISSNSFSLNSLLNSRSVDIVAANMIINTQDVYRAEYANTRDDDYRYEYAVAAVDFNITIEISQDCWLLVCGDTTTNCSVLIKALTKEEKNICILPSYDFANTEVTDNFTPQQITDLTNYINSL